MANEAQLSPSHPPEASSIASDQLTSISSAEVQLPLFSSTSAEQANPPLFSQNLCDSPSSTSFATAPPSPSRSMAPPFISRSSSFSDLPPTDSQPNPTSSSNTSFSTRFFPPPPPRRHKLEQHERLPPSIANAEIIPFNLRDQDEEEEEWVGTRFEEGRKALGPAGGREFLLQRQLHERKGEGLESVEGADESGFSIRERIPVRPTVQVPPSSIDTHHQADLSRKNTTSTTLTRRTLSSPTSSRRKPVPALDESPEVDRTYSQSGQQDQDTPTPRAPVKLRRDPILNASSPTPALSRAQTARRAPPVAGLNSSTSGGTRTRTRASSTDSTGSVSKDSVLRDLGDAIRKERRRKEMFLAETVKAKAELNEIDTNLRIMREKFSTLGEQQELTIQNLKVEIEEIEEELETAGVLDENAAQEYLSLLSNQSLSHLAHSSAQPPIDAFDPSLLRSTSISSPDSTQPSLARSSTILAALKFKRGLTLKRRIDTHLAARDPLSSPPTAPTQSAARVHNFTRENLSTSRQKTSGRPSVREEQSTRERRSTAPSPVHSPTLPPRPVLTPQALPPPADVKACVRPSLSRPSRRPPVSGTTKKYPQDVAVARVGHGDEETRKEGGDLKGRLRRRSNSFKEGFNGTMRVLFPSNAPTATASSHAKGGYENGLNDWLRAA